MHIVKQGFLIYGFHEGYFDKLSNAEMADKS